MFLSNQKIDSIEISAVIKRSDGSIEDLGTIAEYRNKKSIKEIIIKIFKGVIHGIFK